MNLKFKKFKIEGKKRIFPRIKNLFTFQSNILSFKGKKKLAFFFPNLEALNNFKFFSKSNYFDYFQK